MKERNIILLIALHSSPNKSLLRKICSLSLSNFRRAWRYGSKKRNEMNLPRKDKIFIAALLGAITSTIISLWLMYQSGCAGDLKTGTYGDPIEVLRIESIEMQVLFIAMNLYAMAYYLKSKESVPLRIIAALGVMVAVFFISFIPGVYFQGLGFASCH